MTTLTLPLVDNNDEDEEDVRLFITRHNPIISFIRDNKISEVQEWLDEAQRLQDDRWLSSYFVAESEDGIIEHTVLTYACELNHRELVRLFIEYGMDASLQSKDFDFSDESIGTNAMISSLLTENIDLLKYLIEDVGTDINAVDEYGISLIMLIPCRNHLIPDEFSDLVIYLVQQGAKYDQTSHVGDNALLWAAESGNLPVVRFLVELGMDVDHRNKDGHTALSKATLSIEQPIIAFLLDRHSSM